MSYLALSLSISIWVSSPSHIVSSDFQRTNSTLDSYELLVKLPDWEWGIGIEQVDNSEFEKLAIQLCRASNDQLKHAFERYLQEDPLAIRKAAVVFALDRLLFDFGDDMWFGNTGGFFVLEAGRNIKPKGEMLAYSWPWVQTKDGAWQLVGMIYSFKGQSPQGKNVLLWINKHFDSMKRRRFPEAHKKSGMPRGNYDVSRREGE